MKNKAVRLHGVNDLRLEEIDLPAIRDDEILAEVVSDSICMSTHKLAMQGDKHKRVRAPLAATPVIVGHEFCGQIVEVGAKWRRKFKAGKRFAIQPALNKDGTPSLERGRCRPIRCQECRLCIDRSFEDWEKAKIRYAGTPRSLPPSGMSGSTSAP